MILALLRERDMHPYEMLRLTRDRHDERLIRIQQGTFYHQITALERDGLIAEVAVDRQGNRPERTTYTITREGDASLIEWVRRELPCTERPAHFRVALAESHNLDRGTVAELLAGRTEQLRTVLGERRERLADAMERGVQRQFLVEVEREMALMEVDITWTESLVAELAPAGSDSPGTPILEWGIPSHSDRPNPSRKDGE
ncbi:PadR family transcriptional regulator [Leucobacter sp. CSA2]|uniref:PadR family transcriptional regulator n=2 Tax=Leucobacter edaphi TaxID=2796472 RepID=A0A934QEV2_9MICO|nr:PadR family transcriptional regulator [Leucobacter edaphi]MBK0422710.1 PadR family transcriptional regulator [Leucobacter edaphi]